jgi:hypothetical protein
MIKKLLAMACIAAMLLAPVRAQAFEVYSGDQVLQLCAPIDLSVPKIRFCNNGDEVLRGRAQI